MTPVRHDWQAEIAEGVRMRPLHAADIPWASAVVRRAFDSAELGGEVEEQLRIYCDAGLDKKPLGSQADGLPREYYTIESTESGDCLGIAGLYRWGLWTWPKILWLGWFALDPAVQGQSLGGAALRCVMRMARSRGAAFLKVETLDQGSAISFYKHHGFEEEATLSNHYGPGADARVLVRPLDDIEPLDAGSMEAGRV